jgi:ferredoxin
MSAQPDLAVRQVEVRIGDLALLADEGQSLIDLCDWNVTPVQFCCRAGSCGTCLIRVVDGAHNLSDLTDNETILLPELSDDPSTRLACQVRVFGPVCLAMPGKLAGQIK